MKHVKFLTLCLIGIAAMGASFAEKLSQKEAETLLKKADATTSFADTDFAANYTIVQDKPGQGKSSREVVMYRRDSETHIQFSFRHLLLTKEKAISR